MFGGVGCSFLSGNGLRAVTLGFGWFMCQHHALQLHSPWTRDRATLTDMREFVRALDEGAVDVESLTDVHLELAAAEAYLADGKGSPSMKALASLVRIGTLHTATLFFFLLVC